MNYSPHIPTSEASDKMAAMKSLRLVIVDDNVLTSIGLQHLLNDIIPMADITVVSDVSELEDDSLEGYAHFFVASRLYFEHTSFFSACLKKTIVLVNGGISIYGVHTLNICQDEKALVRDLMALHSEGHGGHDTWEKPDMPVLSPRESEMAVLLCKGYRNKEAAEKMGITLATVLSHRKKIMAKLHARSLADILIYAVKNRLVEVADL